MDSEHRHELEENVLAGWLGKKIEQVAPHSSTLVVGALVLVAGAIGWTAYRSTNTASRAEAWRSFTLAVEGSQPSLEALEVAAEEHSGTPVEDWSLITLADGRLWNASNLYLTDKRKAEEALEEAEQLYESLRSAREAVIADRAVYGLARVSEMRGDLKAARGFYASVTGPFAKLAAQRAEELESPRVKQAYAWLSGVAVASDDREDADEISDDPDASLDALLQSLGDEDEGESSSEESSASPSEEGAASEEPADSE